MNCATCREALSARIDSEQEPLSPEKVNEHLLGCENCRRWQAAATRLSRTIRIRPAAATPDLTDRILAAAAPINPARRPTSVFRWALGAVALIQLALALAQLLGVDRTGHTMTGSGEHFFNESAAWNLGLAIGFLVAAVRPSLARGLLPAVAAFVAVLTVVSVADVVSGNVDTGRLGSHTMVVAGLALLFLVDCQERRHPTPGQGNSLIDPSSTAATGTGGTQTEPAGDMDVAQPPRRWLRPAGHRAA